MLPTRTGWFADAAPPLVGQAESVRDESRTRIAPSPDLAVLDRSYTTPLAGFDTPSGVVITPTYGPEADWVKNVLAAETFALDKRGLLRAYEHARLIPRSEAWPHLPRLVRLARRVLRIEWYVYADRSVVAER